MSNAIQERIEVLFEELVPGMGKCDTVAGELIRAICKLRYEMYNNGFGNNVSGALCYIESKIDDVRSEYKELIDHARGVMYNGRYNEECPTVKAMNSLAVKVLDAVELFPRLKATANTEDMYDYGMEELQQCECCGDYQERWEFHSWYGHLCQYCGDDQVRCEEEEEEECY